MKHIATWMRTLLCAALVVVLVSAAMPALAVGQSTTLATSGSKYIVTASGLNVRSGAGMKYPILNSYAPGTPVTILTPGAEWDFVKIGGLYGYMMEQFIVTK